MGLKRRRIADDPLRVSMDEVVYRVTDWEDACGGRYTIETSVVEGLDYALLHVRNVDEVRAKDLIQVVDAVEHVASCGCDFAEQMIVFRFETNQKRLREGVVAPAAPPANDVDAAHKIEMEASVMQRRLVDEAAEDVHLVAWYVVAVKEMLSVLQRAVVRFDITTSPGILTLTVKNLTRVDAALLRKLQSAHDENDIVVFLSPPDSQCVRIRVKKSKRTVNL